MTASKAGADIFVDSTGRGKAPTSFTLNPGKHSVQVVLDGYQDWVQEVSMEPGETTNVTANLRPITTTQATQPANTPSPRPNDMVVKSYIESRASSAAPGSKMKISYIRNGIASETTVTVQRHH